MSIKEAVIKFIEAHKPMRIDTDHIAKEYGSVEGYLIAEGQETSDASKLPVRQ